MERTKGESYKKPEQSAHARRKEQKGKGKNDSWEAGNLPTCKDNNLNGRPRIVFPRVAVCNTAGSLENTPREQESEAEIWVVSEPRQEWESRVVAASGMAAIWTAEDTSQERGAGPSPRNSWDPTGSEQRTGNDIGGSTPQTPQNNNPRESQCMLGRRGRRLRVHSSYHHHSRGLQRRARPLARRTGRESPRGREV